MDEDGGERVRFVEVVDNWSFNQCDAEIVIGEGSSGKGFNEDVDDDVGIVECRVELVTSRKDLGQMMHRVRMDMDPQFQYGQVSQTIVLVPSGLVI